MKEFSKSQSPLQKYAEHQILRVRKEKNQKNLEKQSSENPLYGFRIQSDSIEERNNNLSAELTNKSSIQGFNHTPKSVEEQIKEQNQDILSNSQIPKLQLHDCSKSIIDLNNQLNLIYNKGQKRKQQQSIGMFIQQSNESKLSLIQSKKTDSWYEKVNQDININSSDKEFQKYQQQFDYQNVKNQLKPKFLRKKNKERIYEFLINDQSCQKIEVEKVQISDKKQIKIMSQKIILKHLNKSKNLQKDKSNQSSLVTILPTEENNQASRQNLKINDLFILNQLRDVKILKNQQKIKKINKELAMVNLSDNRFDSVLHSQNYQPRKLLSPQTKINSRIAFIQKQLQSKLKLKKDQFEDDMLVSRGKHLQTQILGPNQILKLNIKELKNARRKRKNFNNILKHETKDDETLENTSKQRKSQVDALISVQKSLSNLKIDPIIQTNKLKNELSYPDSPNYFSQSSSSFRPTHIYSKRLNKKNQHNLELLQEQTLKMQISLSPVENKVSRQGDIFQEFMQSRNQQKSQMKKKNTEKLSPELKVQNTNEEINSDQDRTSQNKTVIMNDQVKSQNIIENNQLSQDQSPFQTKFPDISSPGSHHNFDQIFEIKFLKKLISQGQQNEEQINLLNKKIKQLQKLQLQKNEKYLKQKKSIGQFIFPQIKTKAKEIPKSQNEDLKTVMNNYKKIQQKKFLLSDLPKPPQFVINQNDLTEVQNKCDINQKDLQIFEKNQQIIDYPRHIRVSSDFEIVSVTQNKIRKQQINKYFSPTFSSVQNMQFLKCLQNQNSSIDKESAEIYFNEYLRENQNIQKEIQFKPYEELVKIFGKPNVRSPKSNVGRKYFDDDGKEMNKQQIQIMKDQFRQMKEYPRDLIIGNRLDENFDFVKEKSLSNKNQMVLNQMIANVESKMVSNSQNNVVSTCNSIFQNLDAGYSLVIPKKYKWHESHTAKNRDYAAKINVSSSFLLQKSLDRLIQPL